MVILWFNFPGCCFKYYCFYFFFQQFKGVFYSFTIASFLALLLNHPIQFLENRLGLSKIYAILLVFLTFTLIFSVLGIILLPIIVIKFSALLTILPDWIQSTSLQINQVSYWFNSNNSLVDSQTIINRLTDSFQDQLQGVIQGFPNFVFGTIGNLLSIFLIAVLTIFFLFYGNSFLKNCLHSWFSPEVGSVIHKTLYRNFNSYLLNQVVLSS
ncbi:MAG: AI-2E family transporter [Crocosphaera sp.]|nr:AI-2E family transporter [Crocosphaera sp.]